MVYPRGDGWSLEIWTKHSAAHLDLGESTNPVETIAKAARLIRARIVHVENLRGLPLHLVQGLDDRDLEVILSVHDYTPFCIRPQLVEQPNGRFCEFCTNLQRCRDCLHGVDMGVQKSQEVYRKVGAEAIKKARILVFPSAFMQRQIQELFPMRSAGQREVVLAPATPATEVKPWQADRNHVAFVGGVDYHNGARMIAPAMETMLKRDKKARGFVYGIGDKNFVQQLKKTKGLTLQGYYRPGTLAEMMAKDKIAVAVFPSIWPDPYGLVVDQCLAVGVPVVAYDIGAVADRLRFWEVGQVVRLQHGAPGLATAVFHSIGTGNKVPKDIIKTVPSLPRIARRHWEMYKGLRVRIR
jgi:glycosyltransferase involved in cell wall biosynthesis